MHLFEIYKFFFFFFFKKSYMVLKSRLELNMKTKRLHILEQSAGPAALIILSIDPLVCRCTVTDGFMKIH